MSDILNENEAAGRNGAELPEAAAAEKKKHHPKPAAEARIRELLSQRTAARFERDEWRAKAKALEAENESGSAAYQRGFADGIESKRRDDAFGASVREIKRRRPDFDEAMRAIASPELAPAKDEAFLLDSSLELLYLLSKNLKVCEELKQIDGEKAQRERLRIFARDVSFAVQVVQGDVN